MEERESAVAVVGAGAAGALTALRLLGGGRFEVVLIDPAREAGRGVAYATREPSHLLNAPAGRLSADEGDPGQFVRWACERLGREVRPDEFLPRGLLGDYLGSRLDAVGGRLRRVREHVLAAERCADGVTLRLTSGDALAVAAAVLAVGVPQPGCDWAPDALRESPAFVADPWAPGIDADRGGDVLLVGSGLTMVDLAVQLDRPDRTLHVVSRTGLLPRRHLARRISSPPAPDLTGVTDLDAVWRVASAGRDWRSAVDSLRAATPRIWGGLPETERERFLAEKARYWDSYRHRMAPAAADRLREIRRAGRLLMYTGEVDATTPDDGGLRAELTGGEALRVGTVVNCTGPCHDLSKSTNPLVRSLLESGLAVRGPHGLGLDTGADGRLRANGPLWTIGATRVGTLWESTAFPEIRAQATAVAASVSASIGRKASSRRRPRDRYGLTLSTTREAAAVFGKGIDGILRGQRGALGHLVAATEADPGFALGHAVLALLGLEWGAPVDIAASVRDARAFAAGADSRERSFVAAVAARAADSRAGGRALLRHIESHPRDAFAVNVAVPTISFGGFTSEQETWSLVESLAGHYGDDWWYQSQLAFVRQEQGRWIEAEALASRALAAEPASSHAVHARTHVFYETGAHQEGLAWLNDWIGAWGDTSDGRIHFAWHAALHELMLGDDEAVRRRYDRDLAAVRGPRALVDAASLLWRCEMTRNWDRKDGATAVLASSPQEWLTDPPTSFAAMHAAIAMAAAKDQTRLRILATYAAGHDSEVYRQVVAPLCGGLQNVVAGRWNAAVAQLEQVRPRVAHLGGSAAQREVIEDTFVHALAKAGRHEEAADVLSARLDRRPASPLERGRLAGLRNLASGDIRWQPMTVGKNERARLNGHRPMIVWFTGLSGAGKSTIADLLEQCLHAEGRHTYLLDGDNVRHGLNRDLGFADADRQENIRRVAEVAALMADAGLIVLVSFISPFAAERELARGLVKDGEFCEVFVDTPLVVAEGRDPKGLYRKARSGRLKDFTGIDSPYERPERPEIRIDTTTQTAEDAVGKIMAQLRSMNF
ncbi:adenylyl-sulfate kinase [Amycolatopsis sp. NPDC059657]|uniref:adenylyl-sulfate kinase n=1 Tax=Amycolatopsis sp. NPDC059657 TaxID=3346899 RepID=UPI00366D64FD